jgi:hypothetical protein
LVRMLAASSRGVPINEEGDMRCGRVRGGDIWKSSLPLTGEVSAVNGEFISPPCPVVVVV